MLPLGTPLPAIRLTDAVAGELVDVNTLAVGKRGTLVMVPYSDSTSRLLKKS